MFFKPTFTKSFVHIFFISTHLLLIMDVVLNFYEAAATEKPVCQEETRRKAFGWCSNTIITIRKWNQPHMMSLNYTHGCKNTAWLWYALCKQSPCPFHETYSIKGLTENRIIPDWKVSCTICSVCCSHLLLSCSLTQTLSFKWLIIQVNRWTVSKLSLVTIRSSGKTSSAEDSTVTSSVNNELLSPLFIVLPVRKTLISFSEFWD